MSLLPNDFVVHRKYGIGQYTSIVTKERRLTRLEKSQRAMEGQKKMDRGETPPPDPVAEMVQVMEIQYE